MKNMDHSVLVVDFEGRPMTNGPDGPSLSIRDLIILTLVNLEPSAGAETKARSFGLSQKFYKGKTVNLTSEEISFIKELAGKAMSMLAYGRLCEWLEGETPFIVSDEDENIEADN